MNDMCGSRGANRLQQLGEAPGVAHDGVSIVAAGAPGTGVVAEGSEQGERVHGGVHRKISSPRKSKMRWGLPAHDFSG